MMFNNTDLYDTSDKDGFGYRPAINLMLKTIRIFESQGICLYFHLPQDYLRSNKYTANPKQVHTE